MRAVFYEKMRKDVEDALRSADRPCEVVLTTVMKQNDVELTGVTVRVEGVSVSPTLYLNGYYEMFRDGSTYTDILEEVTDLFENAKPPQLKEEDIVQFDRIKDRVFIRLADPEQNQEWLKGKVYHVEKGWAHVYGIRVDYPGSDASIMIQAEHLNGWRVSADEVRVAAEENLYRENVWLKPMNDVLRSYLVGDDEDEPLPLEIEEFLDSSSPELYVLKTDRPCFGSNILLRKDVMRQVGMMFGGDYYILPSSQHEIIVLSVKGAPSFEALQSMVREINETEVDPGDRLSDDLFYYDRERGRVMKAKEYYAEKLGMPIEEPDNELPEKKKYRDEPER